MDSSLCLTIRFGAGNSCISINLKVGHLVPLIYPMNQFVRVVHEPHCEVQGNPFEKHSRNLGNSKTVKGKMLEPKFPVEKVPAKLLAGHLGNLTGDFLGSE
jgi:hypothetical protein